MICLCGVGEQALEGPYEFAFILAFRNLPPAFPTVNSTANQAGGNSETLQPSLEPLRNCRSLLAKVGNSAFSAQRSKSKHIMKYSKGKEGATKRRRKRVPLLYPSSQCPQSRIVYQSKPCFPSLAQLRAMFPAVFKGCPWCLILLSSCFLALNLGNP